MRPIAYLALSCGLLLSAGKVGKCLAADPAQMGAVTIERAGERLASMTAADLEKLPVVQITVPFGNGPGGKSAAFEGPLLWTVLTEAHALMFVKAGDQVRQIVAVAGHDGYTALLSLGEISPDFEGKQVILAERINGKPLGADHLRIVVPGDVKAGRSVRDVAAISVTSLPAVRR